MTFPRLIILGLFAGMMAATAATAAQINHVTLIDDGNYAYSLEVNATACNGTDLLTSTVGDTFLVQMFRPSCESGEEVTSVTTVEIPECREFQTVQVDLYQDKVQQDTQSMPVDMDIDRQACLEACKTRFESCNATCDGDAACQDDCQKKYEECVDEFGKVEFSLSCHPETLNLKSKGNWITCILESMGENSTSEIDDGSLLLQAGEGAVPADFLKQDDDIMMVKFSRSELIELISSMEDPVFPMTVDLTVTGSLSDGTPIEASDSITAINPGNGKKVETVEHGAEHIQGPPEHAHGNSANDHKNKGKKNDKKH